MWSPAIADQWRSRIGSVCSQGFAIISGRLSWQAPYDHPIDCECLPTGQPAESRGSDSGNDPDLGAGHRHKFDVAQVAEIQPVDHRRLDLAGGHLVEFVL